MNVLNKLVDKGNTVIVREHNLDVIKMADYIIDMGPEGGKGGGELLSCGKMCIRDRLAYQQRQLGKYLNQCQVAAGCGDEDILTVRARCV